MKTPPKNKKSEFQTFKIEEFFDACPIDSLLQVVYFTATFPYFILFALLINNMQLPGAKEGVLYFVTPVWNKLFEVKVKSSVYKCNCIVKLVSNVSIFNDYK